MKHFVQYHNIDAQGGRPTRSTGRFEIFSRKSLHGLPRHTVWLVSGEGKTPKRYYLEYVFLVEGVMPGDPGRAWGSEGQRFDPPLPLNDLPWFNAFKKSQQNFSLGLREISTEFVADFRCLAQGARFDGVRPHEYLSALRAVQASLSSAQMEMLVGHANTPGQCLSMARLAEFGGYKSYEAGNSQYGRLGELLARALGMAGQLDWVDKTSALATAAYERDERGHWQWKMRPALRDALCQLWPEHVLPEMADKPQDFDAELRPTERAALIQARVGQGRYRKEMMSLWQGRCALTGLDVEAALVASHAKPWRHCNNAERLDPFNGLLLSATCDRLFDSGLISFDDRGGLLVSPALPEDALQRSGVRAGQRLARLRPEHAPYLVAHRTTVFKASS